MVRGGQQERGGESDDDRVELLDITSSVADFSGAVDTLEASSSSLQESSSRTTSRPSVVIPDGPPASISPIWDNNFPGPEASPTLANLGFGTRTLTEDWIQRQQPVAVGQAGLRRYQTRRVKLTQGYVFSADYPYPPPIFGLLSVACPPQLKILSNQNGDL